MFHSQFHFHNKILFTSVLFGTTHLYWILDLENEINWKWDLKSSDLQECKWQYYSRSWAGWAAVFGRIQKFPWRAALPGSNTHESSCGAFNVRLLHSEDAPSWIGDDVDGKQPQIHSWQHANQSGTKSIRRNI